ncbi:hypothetical protein D9M72_407730 [compost metagenome]
MRDHLFPCRLDAGLHRRLVDNRAVKDLQCRADRLRNAGGAQGGIHGGDIQLQRSCRARRTPCQQSQGFMLDRRELRQQHGVGGSGIAGAIVDTNEYPPQPHPQFAQGRAAEQPLQPGIGARIADWVGHASGNLLSGSLSCRLARPSQVQRETKTASMPSRRWSWQMDTPGNSA